MIRFARVLLLPCLFVASVVAAVVFFGGRFSYWHVLALNLADAVLWWGLFMASLSAWCRFFPQKDIPEEAVKGVTALISAFILLFAPTAFAAWATWLILPEVEFTAIAAIVPIVVIACVASLWGCAISFYRRLVRAISWRHGVIIGSWTVWRKALAAFAVAFTVGTAAWIAANGLAMGGISHLLEHHVAEGECRHGGAAPKCIACRLENARKERANKEPIQPWRPERSRISPKREYNDATGY